MPEARWLIVGTGVIGAILLRGLRDAGVDVTVLARDTTRKGQLLSDGLVIHDVSTDQIETLRPAVVTPAEISTSYDVVVLAVRRHHLNRELAAGLEGALGAHTRLVSMFSSMDSGGAMRGLFPETHPVVAFPTAMGGWRDELGVHAIVPGWAVHFVSSPRDKDVLRGLRAAGFRVLCSRFAVSLECLAAVFILGFARAVQDEPSVLRALGGEQARRIADHVRAVALAAHASGRSVPWWVRALLRFPRSWVARLVRAQLSWALGSSYSATVTGFMRGGGDEEAGAFERELQVHSAPVDDGEGRATGD